MMFDVLQKIIQHFNLTYVATIDENFYLKENTIEIDHHDFWETLWGNYSKHEYEALPIDPILIRQMSYCETIVLRMMDRIDPLHPKDYNFRKNLYLKHLHYWNSFLENQSITHFICVNVPHEMADYVIYNLCKIKKIKTLMFSQSSIPDITFLYESIETGPDRLIQKYQEVKKCSDKFKLSSQLEKHFLERTSVARNMQPPFYMTTVKSEIKRSHSTRYFLKRIFSFSFSAFKKNKEPKLIFIWNLVKEGLWRFFRRQLLLHSDKNLWKSYKKIATTEPDLNKSYIYVALHFQPENTTSPGGGCFVDQLLCLKMLCSLIPDNVYIYVKEHPAQRSQGRTCSFYDDVLKLKNICLVATNFSSFSLIEKSLAVVTVTGTVGWEALFFEKPVFMFGYFFYQFAPGVYPIRSIDDCRIALEEVLQKKVTHSLIEIHNFLIAAQNVGVTGYSDMAYRSVSQVHEETNKENLFQALKSKIYELNQIQEPSI